MHEWENSMPSSTGEETELSKWDDTEKQETGPEMQSQFLRRSVLHRLRLRFFVRGPSCAKPDVFGEARITCGTHSLQDPSDELLVFLIRLRGS